MHRDDPTGYYDDIFEYKQRQPLEVLIHKANSLKPKEVRPHTSYSCYETLDMRPGAKEALKLTQTIATKARKPQASPKVKKNNVELALDKLRSYNSTHKQARTPPPGSVYDTASSRKSPQMVQMVKRELTPKQAHQIYTRLVEHDDQRKQTLEEKQAKRTKEEMSGLDFKPKISQRSKELAEQRFSKLKTAPNDKNARMLNVRSQQSQTEQNCTEVIKNYHSKQGRKAASAKQTKPKKPVESQQLQPPQHKEMQIQTEPFAEPEMAPRTPQKSQIKEAQQSGQKESSYVPLHERYQYIMEQQKDHMRKLVTEQEEREKKTLSQPRKKEEDEDPFSERLERFLETQSDWVNRKQGRLMTEKVKKYNPKEVEQSKPLISKKSERIVKAKFPKTFQERQQNYIAKRTMKIDQLTWQLESPHYPIIAPKSRMICEQVSDRQMYRQFHSAHDSQHYQ